MLCNQRLIFRLGRIKYYYGLCSPCTAVFFNLGVAWNSNGVTSSLLPLKGAGAGVTVKRKKTNKKHTFILQLSLLCPYEMQI